MRPTSESHARIVLGALVRSLDDLIPAGLAVSLSASGPIRGLRLYTIDITFPEGGTISYSPYVLENGAGGIDIDILIDIRQRMGEDIPDRPVSPHAGQFADIISYGTHFERGT